MQKIKVHSGEGLDIITQSDTKGTNKTRQDWFTMTKTTAKKDDALHDVLQSNHPLSPYDTNAYHNTTPYNLHKPHLSVPKFDG